MDAPCIFSNGDERYLGVGAIYSVGNTSYLFLNMFARPHGIECIIHLPLGA
jgi:hypothetical protein